MALGSMEKAPRITGQGSRRVFLSSISDSKTEGRDRHCPGINILPEEEHTRQLYTGPILLGGNHFITAANVAKLPKDVVLRLRKKEALRGRRK